MKWAKYYFHALVRSCDDIAEKKIILVMKRAKNTTIGKVLQRNEISARRCAIRTILPPSLS